MAESLRDLVVTLALESGDFNKGVKTVTNQIKEIESAFKNAGAGLTDYENTLSGMSQKASTLQQEMRKQAEIVDILTEKYQQQADAVEKAYKNKNNRVTELQTALAKSDGSEESLKAIADAQEKVNSASKAILTSESKLAAYGADLQNAQARLKELNAAFDENDAAMQKAAGGWQEYDNALKQSQNALTGIGTQMQLVQSQFNLEAAQSGIKNFGETTDTVGSKISMLEQQMTLAQQTVKEYETQISALSGQKSIEETIASKTQDWSNVDALNQKIAEATVKMTDAQTAAVTYGNALNELKTKASGGWFDMAAQIESSKTALTGLATEMQLVQSQFNFEAAKSGLSNFGETASTVSSNISMLEQQMAIAQQTVKEYEAQISALSGQKGIAEKLGDTSQVNELTQKIREAAVAMTDAKTSVETYGRSLDELKTKASGGWFNMEAEVEKANQTIKTLGEETELAKSKFELLASQNGGMDTFSNSITGMTEKSKLLREEAERLSETIQAYSDKISALQGEKSIAESLGDTTKVNQLNSEINELATAMNNAQANANNLKREAEQLGSKFQQLGTSLGTAGDKLTTLGSNMKRVGSFIETNLSKPIRDFANDCLTSAQTVETAMATVKKAFMGESEEVYSGMSQYATTMSETIGTSASEIMSVLSMVGQMGISTDSYQEFTDVVLKLGKTTDMSMSDITKNLAQYSNITGMSLTNISNLGSTVEYLGVNMQTTEADIIAMSTSLAAAGSQVGLTDAEILGISATLSSVGVSAQKGGTAFSKALIKMETAVVDWENAVSKGEDTSELALNDFASVSGMTAQDFATTWRSNGAIEPFSNFINGLANMSDEGISAISTLNDLGFSEVRLRDTVLRTTNANELFNKSIGLANKAWNENTALDEAASTVMDTTATRVENLKNKFTNLKTTIGNDLTPTYETAISKLSGVVDYFSNMSEDTRTTIEKVGVAAGIAGPTILTMGTAIRVVGVTAKGASNTLKALKNGATLGSVLSSSTGAALAFSTAVIAIGAGAVYATKKINEWRKSLQYTYEAEQNLAEASRQWSEDIKTGFETAAGLSAFGIDSSVQFTISFDEADARSQGESTGNAWLDGLVTVWTDGQKETDEILNNWVSNSGITDLQKRINESTSGSSEERSQAISDLDKINAKIQKILKNKQNRLLSQSEIDELNSLWGEAHEIGLQFNIELTGAGASNYSDLTSLYTSIETGIQAALARGASSESVWDNAFSSLTSGYSQYMDQLNSSFDTEYAKIWNNNDLTFDEKNTQTAALVEKYNQMGTSAGEAYMTGLTNAMNATGITFNTNDSVYGETIDQLNTIASILPNIMNGTATEGELSTFMNTLSSMDETKVVEMETALTAMGSTAADAGLNLEDVNTDAANLSTTLATLKSMASGDWSGLLSNGTVDGASIFSNFQSMFGTANDAEVLQVTATLNADELSTAYNTWATTGEHAAITATIDLSGVESLEINATNGVAITSDASGCTASFTGGLSIDAGTGTVVAVNAEGAEITPKTITLANVSDTDADLSGTDENTFEVPIETINLTVANGKITEIQGISADGSVLSDLKDSEGNELTLESLKVSGLLEYSAISIVDDGTALNVPVNAIINQVNLPDSVELPTIDTSKATALTANFTGISNRNDFANTTISKWLGFDGVSLNDILKEWASAQNTDDIIHYDNGIQQVLSNTFTNGNSSGTFGQMYWEYINAALSADPGTISTDVANSLMSSFSNVLSIIDPNSIAYQYGGGSTLYEQLFNAVMGDGADINSIEDNSRFQYTLNAMYTALGNSLTNYTPETQGTSWWDSIWEWMFPSASAEEMTGGDDSLAGTVTDAVQTQVDAAAEEVKNAGYGDQIMAGVFSGAGDGADGDTSGVQAAIAAMLVTALTGAGNDPSVAAAAQAALGSAMGALSTDASAGGGEGDATGLSAQVAAQLAAALTAAGMDESVTAAGAAAVASALSSVNGGAGGTEGAGSTGGGSEGGGLSAQIAAQLAAALTAAGSDPSVAAAGATAFATALSSVGGGGGSEGGGEGGGGIASIAGSVASMLSGAVTAGASDGSVSSAAASAISTMYGYLSSEGGKGYSGDFGIGATLSSAVAMAHVTGNVDISGITTSGADSIGAQIARGIASGITANTGAIRSAAASAARAALAAAKASLGIHSPSRVFRDEVGANIMKGIGVGITEQTKTQGKVIANAMRYLTKSAGGYGVATGGGAYGGGYSTNNYNDSSSVNIYGNFSVRDDRDVRELAREISSLTKSAQAGKGQR